MNCGASAGFAQTTVELGAFVDALGKSVLRIHNIAVAFTDVNGRSPDMDANSDAAAQFQITTQSQTDIIRADDKALLSSGLMNCRRSIAGNGVAGHTSESFDNVAQTWSKGMLVAVEQIYLGGSASSGFNEDVYASIVMECTVETLSEKASLALALSQQ